VFSINSLLVAILGNLKQNSRRLCIWYSQHFVCRLRDMSAKHATLTSKIEVRYFMSMNTVKKMFVCWFELFIAASFLIFSAPNLLESDISLKTEDTWQGTRAESKMHLRHF
jgi:hypothetical protein